MADYLLGIDIGTSACKIAVFTLDGAVIAQSTAEYQISYPCAGWAEQQPEDWWHAVCRALSSISKQGVSLSEIRGIGVDGQSWSAIPMDKEGRVLHANPIWFDTRAEQICIDLKRRVSEEQIFNLCGNSLQASYTLPKILWFRQEMPEVYQHTYKFLQSNSFIVYRFTGCFSQDRSQGYGLQCYDMKKGTWDRELCEKMGVDLNKLPELYDSHQVVGTVTQQASIQTGLPKGIPVVAGGLDAACGALGAGVLLDGQTQEQGGQAGGMSICMERYHADPRLILGAHVVPGKWLLQGGTVGGGGVMRWLSQQFGTDARLKAEKNGTNLLMELDKEAESVAAGADGVVFLPYMAGERSPIWNSQAKGVFYGLDFAKTKAHLVRAAMEGVAFSLRHNLEVAEEAGVTVSVLHAMGGAANSQLWTQMKADVTGKEILVPASDTATTLGAAILAGVGIGKYQSFEEAVAKTVKIRKRYVPNISKKKIYDNNYSVYRGLYQSLRPIMNHREAV